MMRKNLGFLLKFRIIVINNNKTIKLKRKKGKMLILLGLLLKEIRLKMRGAL